MMKPPTYALLIVLILIIQLSSTVFSQYSKEFYPSERNDLLRIRDTTNSTSNLHTNWTGPPCYFDQSRWVGVGCSKGHIVRLVLEGVSLRGSLPRTFLQNLTSLSRLSFRNNFISGPLPTLANLINLEDVLLSNNRFSGTIPSEYIELPKLTSLELQENNLDGRIPPFNQSTLVAFNVSYNHLGGQIPHTHILQNFPKSSYDHNPGLCGDLIGTPCPVLPPPPPKNKHKRKLQVWTIALIVAAAAAAALVLCLIMALFLCYRRRSIHKKDEPQEQTGGTVEFTETAMHQSQRSDDPERVVELEFFNKETPVFDLDDLLRASAEVLGKGKLGTTYKAMLESGLVVAVKRLANMNGLTKKEFIQQMQLLGSTRHENLVEIISFYYSREEKLVICEYMPDGNLYELLHGNRGAGRLPIDWSTRLSIIKQIARGLNSLHQSLSSRKVPHANLKSSNVLLRQDGKNYKIKLTDYGFLPLLPDKKFSKVLAIGKTPEFCQGRKLTHRADVYCFGIVILEIITGKVPGEISPGNEDKFEDLSDWVRKVVNDDWSTDILDIEIVAAKEGHDEMLGLTQIALECTDEAPEKRPKMSELLRRIEEIEINSTSNE